MVPKALIHAGGVSSWSKQICVDTWQIMQMQPTRRLLSFCRQGRTETKCSSKGLSLLLLEHCIIYSCFAPRLEGILLQFYSAWWLDNIPQTTKNLPLFHPPWIRCPRAVVALAVMTFRMHSSLDILTWNGLRSLITSTWSLFVDGVSSLFCFVTLEVSRFPLNFCETRDTVSLSKATKQMSEIFKFVCL